MNKLQEIRKNSGLSQEEIADKLGISQQAYARYEKENIEIPSQIRATLERILLCDLSETKREIFSINGFLDDSLTAFHAVKNTKTILESNGFTKLELGQQKWDLTEGSKHYLTINDSAIIAFKIGDLSSYAFNIASCHTDSPCLKIKGNELINSAQGKRINVETYGGLINYSFMDIPLYIGGRIITQTPNGLKQSIYSSSFKVNIPSLCIHHNPSVNQGMELKPQEDMLPLLGFYDDLYSLISPKEPIVDADLYCVPAIKSTYCGVNGELLVSPRIDNLSSLYSIIMGLLSSSSKSISIMYATDNEEIGSLSKQGAHSEFLTQVLRKINRDLGKSEDDFDLGIQNGFVLSIDNGHAASQSHIEKSDPVNRCLMNDGVVIKHHAHYSTDGVSSSIVKTIANKADVKVQDYYNNSDIRCGSTIGLVTSSQLAIKACDIGLAQLAMHSGVETVGKYDILRMIDLVKSYYETFIPELFE